jgi:hypothetical protein
MPVLVQKHIVGFYIAMYEAHVVDGVERENYFHCIKDGPFFRYLVQCHQSNNIAT